MNKHKAEQHRIAAQIEETGCEWDAFCPIERLWITQSMGRSPCNLMFAGCEIRIKPTPKQIPLERNDWIVGGPWWIREGVTSDLRSVAHISTEHVTVRGFLVDHRDMMSVHYERTNDGINFHPCSKPAP